MAEKPVIVFARIKAQKNKIEDVRKALEGLVGPTRKESGCMQYDLHQSNEDTSLFYFYETWKDEAAHRSHLQQPHVGALVAQAASLLADAPEIQMVRRLS